MQGRTIESEGSNLVTFDFLSFCLFISLSFCLLIGIKGVDREAMQGRTIDSEGSNLVTFDNPTFYIKLQNASIISNELGRCFKF